MNYQYPNNHTATRTQTMTIMMSVSELIAYNVRVDVIDDRRQSSCAILLPGVISCVDHFVSLL